ncbi:MAG: nucleotidyltransferase [Clostridiales bacterium]|nr:nucleotidyltransferase [Clostridiales bacterium]
MKVLGIIAEYNPFHLGHAYQIETLKKQTQADYVIIAMSGNFVQRGAPALVEKFTRTHMALTGGADLVLELPVLSATASAEYFALGGVSLLNNTGVVTHLGFGAEHANLSLLQQISDALIENPPELEIQLKSYLKEGLSFPSARAKALTSVLSTMALQGTEDISCVLASPNNILGIEYLKALASLSSPIVPVPLSRKGQGYHDTDIAEGFCSASAIRAHLKNEAEILTANTFVASSMPAACFDLLQNYPHPFLFEDDFSQLVHYKLLTEDSATLATYADSSIDLANRMYHGKHSFASWTQFCELLKAKNTTYTRISRLLLHMILNLKSEDYVSFNGTMQIPYLRVLGFRKSSAPLLSAIKENATVPLLTSVSNGEKQLSFKAMELLQKDITASDIYHMMFATNDTLNDYRHPLVIL